MKITLITATYNSEKNIQDCLESVAGQSYKNIEHIILDGGSTDNTLEIVKSFPSVTKYISEPDKGIYDALNKGIQLATGDVIGFLHSDDMLASSTIIERITNSFSPSLRGSTPPQEEGGGQHPRIENSEEEKQVKTKIIHGVYGNLIFVDNQNTNKTVRTWQSKPFNRKNIKNGWMPPHPTLFFKKEVYKKHGLFDISFKIAGDYDFMLRVMLDKEINLQYLPETITKIRTGGISTGSIKNILLKKKEDIRALRNNGFRFPLKVLVIKNLKKIP